MNLPAYNYLLKLRGITYQKTVYQRINSAFN